MRKILLILTLLLIISTGHSQNGVIISTQDSILVKRFLENNKKIESIYTELDSIQNKSDSLYNLLTKSQNIQNNRKSNWLRHYGISQEHFIETSVTEKESFYSTEYDPYDESIRIYNRFLIYSPDSSCFIDLDSYSLMLERNDAGELITYGTEVDMQAALVSITEKIRKTLIFCGTACLIEEAEWIDNNTVCILGFTDPDENPTPTIWTFHLSVNKIVEAQAKVIIFNKPYSYLTNVRLKDVKFE